MKNNQPVTQQERHLDPKRPIVTKTDLQGVIRYANPAFIEISGFNRSELIGANHHVVRHPDMPPAAFADLWHTIKADQPWKGLVKNRSKNGDFYWVEAYVTPLYENGNKVGYMSVRAAPSRADIQVADQLYRDINAGRASFPATQRKPQLAIGLRLAAVLGAVSLCALGAAALSAPEGRWALAVVTVLIALGGGWWVFQGVASPLARAVEAIRRISEGDLKTQVDSRAPAEFFPVLMGLESLRVGWRALVADILTGAHGVGLEAKALEGQVNNLQKHAHLQSDGISSVAAALEELSVSVREISEATNNSSHHASQTRNLAQTGTGQMAASAEATQGVVALVRDSLQTVSTLSDSVRQISSIAQTIKEIADQTNLLALNAAIEAARAGESGRGFAVVADEVRKLAERTASSTQSIAGQIGNIEAQTKQALGTMHDTVAAMNQSKQQIDATGQSLTAILAASQEVSASAAEIANMLEQQSNVSTEVANSMERMSSLTESNAGSIKGIGVASSDLAGTAEEFHALVRHFERSL